MGIFSDLFKKRFTAATTYIMGVGTKGHPRPINLETEALVSAIIDTNSTHISRGQVLHVRKDSSGRVAEIKRASEYTKLFESPNDMMTRQDFLYSMAWQLHLCNLALAWIKWEGAHPVAIYPLIYLNFEVRKRTDGGYAVLFSDVDGERYTLPIEDLIVIRRKYNGVGYTGQGNDAIKNTLDMVSSLDEGLKQAVEISNKIHGILRQKNAMLATNSAENLQKSFFNRLKSATDNGGVISLDATEDYTPLSVSAWSANAAQQKQVTDRVYTFWRTPEEVVRNIASEQIMQNYYDAIIEPVWEEMAEAFTKALFTKKEQGYGNRITVTSGAATGASWATKLSIVANTKDLGLLTPNEYRELLGYAPVKDGDERQVSLNYVKASDQSNYQTGNDTEDNTNTEE